MSRIRRVAAGVIVAASMTVVTAGPSAAAPTTVSKDVTKTVAVYGQTTSSDGCVTEDTVVFATQDNVQYQHATFDCRTGVTTGVVGEAAPERLNVRGDLSTARVVADIPLLDYNTLEPTGEMLSLDERFTAVGKAVTNRSVDTFHSPGVTLQKVTLTQKSVEAVGQGTVSLETGFMTTSREKILSVNRL